MWATEEELAHVEEEIGHDVAVMLQGSEALWPGRWPIRAIPDCDFNCPKCEAQSACLIGKRREVGPLVFDREFLCNPRSSVSSLFPLDMFTPMLNKKLQFTSSTHDWAEDVREQFVISTGWDFALSEKVAADYTCKYTVAMNRETRRRQILEIKRWKGLTFDRQLHEIVSSYERYHDDAVILETTLFQRLYKNWATSNRPDMPVVGHNTGTEKQDLAAGIPSLLILLERQQYVIPYMPGVTREMVDVWLAECMAYGWVNDKLQGVGEHDDSVIAWWLAEIGLKRFGSTGWGATYLGIDDTVEI